jgi:pyruvate,water dikinase
MGTIVRLEEAQDVASVGGKSSALAKMIKAGFRVPDGFVVGAAAKTMDKHLTGAVLAAFDKLGAPEVAVRSSALAEDGANDTWAGQMDTFLNVDRSGLIGAIEKCWQSSNSERAKAYAEEKGLPAGRVAVVVQKMINGDVSGVAFSVNPVTNDKNQIVIEAVRGLADKLVSGEATPDNYIVSRAGEVIDRTLQRFNPFLDQNKLGELAHTTAKLEEYFGFPVDVEWTFKDNQLCILQSRPITTLG